MKLLSTLIVAATCTVAAFTGICVTSVRAADTFVIATPLEPDTTDISKTRLPPLTRGTLTNINEPLIDVDAKGNPKPGIATWRLLNQDKTIEFKIRPGVKFHTGDPLTSADIKFSHERQAVLNNFYQRQVVDLDRVEAPDASTIRFVFKHPNPLFLRERALMILSKAYFDRVGEEEFSAKPVGTGPYKFVQYKFGQYLDLAAFEDYWGGSPKIKKARLEFIKDDETRLAKLRSGEADLIMHAPYGAIKQLKTEGFKTTTVPVHPTTTIYFHTLNPKAPWADIRVRKAIAMAIDGKAIVNGPLQGIPNRFPCLGPDEVGYDPNLKLLPYDPKAARALLGEAGYGKGFTMPMYYMVGSYAGMKETAEAIVLSLRPLGINVQLQGLEQLKAVEMLRNLHKDKNGMMVALHPLTIASTPEPAQSLKNCFGTNLPFALHGNSAVDEPLYKASITMDDKQRGLYIRQAAKILLDDVAFIPMWSGVSVYAMKPTVTYVGIPRTSGGAWIRVKDIQVKQ